MMMQQTSLAAYSSIKSKLNRNQRLVLDALEEIHPASNKQVAEYMKWPINSVTPRMLELRKKSKVVQAYVGRDLGGRKAIFWKPRNKDEYGDTH